MASRPPSSTPLATATAAPSGVVRPTAPAAQLEIVRQDIGRESELHDNILSIMVAKLRPEG